MRIDSSLLPGEVRGRCEDPETGFGRIEAGAIVGGGGPVTLKPQEADSAFCNEGMLSSMQNVGKAAAPEGVLREPRIHADRERFSGNEDALSKRMS
jgi:hypothetical protein